MATAPAVRTVHLPRVPVQHLVGAGLVLAFIVGIVTPVRASLAPLVAIGGIVAIAVLRAPSLILAVLLGSVFVETITIGGVTIARAVAPSALAITVIALVRRAAPSPRGPILLWAGAYGMWALASGLWTVDPAGTTYLLGSLAIAVVFMLAFAVLVRSEAELRRVFGALALIALPISVFAVIEFFGGAGRSAATKGDPNSFAAYELIALPLVLVLANEARSPRLRAALYATVLFVIAAVMTSLSRGGLITLAGLVLLISLLPVGTIFRSRRQKAAVLSAVVLATLAGYAITGSAFTARIDLAFASSGQTGSGRLDLWRGALHSIRQRPVLGIGYGSFSSVSNQLLLTTPGVDLVNFVPPPKGDLVHDTYLETLAELGVPGLVAFAGLLAAAVLTLRRTARDAARLGLGFLARAANAVLLSLGCWALAGAFLSLETARPLWILFGLTIALRSVVARASVTGSSRHAGVDVPASGA